VPPAGLIFNQLDVIVILIIGIQSLSSGRTVIMVGGVGDEPELLGKRDV
jgi:hypothetical protein